MSTHLLSGDEAIALAALDMGVTLGVGYPGTPSTEILERLAELGGRAQWSPNEKVALEVGIGVSYGGGRALVTMKHVGVNVAADPLFTVAYTGVEGGLVLVSADDPGMHSSQNEQDNRRYAVAAAVPMLEPSDSQEAYDFLRRAFELSEEYKLPVILRTTTRVCHSKSIVRRAPAPVNAPHYTRDIRGRVMVPGNARPAHHRLRASLARLTTASETEPINTEIRGSKQLGIVTSGISFVHAREAVPDASILKLGLTYPLPMKKIKAFVESVERCVVIEEGDPVLLEALRTACLNVDGKDEMYRFGELNVDRVRRIVNGDRSEEPAPTPGKPPQLCPACPHRTAFSLLNSLQCIVAGDIGCYSLGVMPPFEAMDTLVCMGASIGVGLGLRHTLPEAEARRVISVIGDSTFAHSGLTGIVDMVYNPPPTGHVVLILDNDTTAMTGLQDHPGTGRTLNGGQNTRLDFEAVIRAMGVPNVHTIDPIENAAAFEKMIVDALAATELTVIIARRPCILLDKHHDASAQPCATESTHVSGS
jgi:indolepyruvate ferredoxin oxidoreductase alpha subunit